jgi:hypothetical protein
MNNRNRGISSVGKRTRLAIAAAVLVGGSAAGVVALSASHGSTTAAQSAGFSQASHHTIGEAVALSEVLGSNWNPSSSQSLSTLAQMTPMRTFTQVTHHRVIFAAQRGIVVLATKKFLVVKSFNGSLHAWFLSGGTRVKDVSSASTGFAAMTGSQTATTAAMTVGNMTPATNVMVGSTSTVSQLTTPVVKPTTITITTGTETITITVANTTATTTTAVTSTQTTSVTQPIFKSTMGIQRGDLVFVAGTRTRGQLKAQLVLFAAPLNTMPSATSFPTSTSTSFGTPTVTPSAGSTFTGSHS